MSSDHVPSDLIASHPVLSFMYRRLSHHQPNTDPVFVSL